MLSERTLLIGPFGAQLRLVFLKLPSILVEGDFGLDLGQPFIELPVSLCVVPDYRSQVLHTLSQSGLNP